MYENFGNAMPNNTLNFKILFTNLNFRFKKFNYNISNVF